MNEHDVELLLQEFKGPKPAEGLLDTIKNKARVPEEMSQTAASSKTSLFNTRVLIRAAAVLILLGTVSTVLFNMLQQNANTVTPAINAGIVKAGKIKVARNGSEEILEQGQELFSGDMFTSLDEKGAILLADGSELTADRKTEFVLDKGGKDSEVRILLKKGRLFADVADRNGIPFVIKGSAEVSVKGTAFGVEEENGKIRVDVLEGKVSVTGGERKIVLSRGESGTGSAVEAVITGDNPHAGTAWIRDWIVFEKKPLIEITNWIERKSAYRFIDLQNKLQEHTVSISIADEPFRYIIDSLMLSCMLRYRIDGYDVIIED